MDIRVLALEHGMGRLMVGGVVFCSLLLGASCGSYTQALVVVDILLQEEHMKLQHGGKVLVTCSRWTVVRRMLTCAVSMLELT